MGRLRHFPEHRYVGARDSMIVYDCDDDGQLAVLTGRITDDDLLDRKLLQSFAPDTLPEARNRGFRPTAPSEAPAGSEE